jgi:hypothetical protein
MELTEQEQKFFESGGETEVPEEVVETPEVVAETPKEEVKAEVVEKKEPSKFTYSKDTDNIVDENGRKYVPLGAIQEARNENKTLKKELDELKQKWTGGEQKLEALMKRFAPKEDEPPAYDKNPLEHLKAKNDALEKEISAIKESQGKTEQQSEAQRQQTAFQAQVQSAERKFAVENPGYGEAVARVQEVWRAELEMAGVPDNLIESTLSRRGAAFSAAAMRKDQNPAEAVFKLAQRYGFKAEKEKDEPNKDKDKLATIAKGQEAAKSLSSGKGAGEMSLEALATMSDEEMDAFVADPKAWKKLSKAA